LEVLGVEEVAAIAGEAGEVFEGKAGGAIEGDAAEGVADGGEVDTDWMGADGVEVPRRGRTGPSPDGRGVVGPRPPGGQSHGSPR